MKFWNFTLVALVFCVLSCQKDHSEISSESPYPIGKEYKIRLNIPPFLEIEEQPLGSRTTTGSPKGLYAVNVFWKGKGSNYQPYASGLFDDSSRVEIGLIEGYIYRFDCTYLDANQLPYSKTENDTIYYGLPFSRSVKKQIDGFVTNDLLISIEPLNTSQTFYQCIYSGEMQTGENSTSTHPVVKRYYGSRELDFMSAQNLTSASIKLYRACYSLLFTTTELAPGDSIKIEAKDIDPLYLTYTHGSRSATKEPTISMNNISEYYSGKIKDSEIVAFTIAYRPSGEGQVWQNIYTNQSITLKREKRNIIKIVDISHHIGNVDIDIEEGADMENDEQELK